MSGAMEEQRGAKPAAQRVSHKDAMLCEYGETRRA
jgi:hypothetical protein